jgi:hypothetical protein
MHNAPANMYLGWHVYPAAASLRPAYVDKCPKAVRAGTKAYMIDDNPRSTAYLLTQFSATVKLQVTCPRRPADQSPFLLPAGPFPQATIARRGTTHCP